MRKTFVQQGTSRVRDPGPIATLCSNHDERALDLYLLVHAAAIAAPFDVTLPGLTWARAIGLGTSSSARSAVSKAFTRLVRLNLIERGTRAGNRSPVVLLDEGGHGEPYVHPATARQKYLKLPHDYWTDGWHLTLDLSSKVMLLIALSLDDAFTLPIERAKDWYGISSDTAQRGLARLGELGVVDVDMRYRKEPLAAEGFTQARHFTLTAPFGPRRKPTATVTKLKVG